MWSGCTVHCMFSPAIFTKLGMQGKSWWDNYNMSSTVLHKKEKKAKNE